MKLLHKFIEAEVPLSYTGLLVRILIYETDTHTLALGLNLKVAIRQLRPGHVVIFNDGNREITQVRKCLNPGILIHGHEGTKVAIEITFSSGEQLVGYPSTVANIEPLNAEETSG